MKCDDLGLTMGKWVAIRGYKSGTEAAAVVGQFVEVGMAAFLLIRRDTLIPVGGN